jgi:hypothetical protein
VTSLGPSPWIVFIIASAVAGLAFVILAFVTQMSLQRRRLKRFQDLELIPNILLTRHPVLFVGRNRSLFRLSGDFLELPIYLKEHGFQVEEVELQTRGMNSTAVLAAVSSLLRSSVTLKTHLFLSADFADLARDLARDLAFDGHPGLASLTVIGPHKINHLHLRPPRVPLHVRPDLKPRLANFDFQTERSALDHVVSLAESDLR